MGGQFSWRPLPVTAPGVPNLLISADFTAQSYTVHITDLANIWTESLDRKRIVARGLENDISIDLTDGADQIRRMLDYVQAALDPSNTEHENTSLGLSTRRDEADSLLLHVTCILPRVLNLKPLEWPLILKKRPYSAVAAELVLPLVVAHRTRAREIEALVAALREKDSVISKLVDKLEATGTGLEHVFSALSGKRKVSRSLAEQRIKGLAPFDHSEFKDRIGSTEDANDSDLPDLLDDVFGSEPFMSETSPDEPADLDDWWMKLSSGKSVTLVNREKQNQGSTPAPAQESVARPGDEDDFQVQSSPPGRSRRLRDASPAQESITARQQEDEGTTDDGDSDDQGAPLVTEPEPKQMPSRIGVIGGKKTSAPPPLQPSPSPPAAPQDDSEAGSETASDSDDDAPPPRPGTVSSPAPKRPGIGHIGRIGGTAGQAKPAAAPPVEESTPVSEETRGRSIAKADQQSSEIKQEARETSLERADRKRQELQRDLEARAATGPAKKKRKF